MSAYAVNPVILSFPLQHADGASDPSSHTNFHNVHFVSLERGQAQESMKQEAG